MQISLLLMEEIAKLFVIMLLACVAAVLVHVLFLILTAILKQILQLDAIERATVIYSNAGILVIPLVQELLGQEYVIYSSAYIAVQLILIWTHCKNMLCEEDRLELKKVFLNVNIISIIVGVILFICKIQLPSGMQDVLDMMNNMIGPIGMLLAGMVIADILTTLLSIVTMPVMVGMYEMFV